MRQWCVWGGSEGGVVVLKSRGERMALLNVSGTGVYGMKSQADLMCDGETKCKESAAWLHQEGTLGNFIGSVRGRMRSDLQKGGGYRRSAECVWITVVRCAAQSGTPVQGSAAAVLGFHNINQVDKVTPPCDKWVRRHGPRLLNRP